MATMGHQPFRELTKHFTAEDRAYIEAGKAKIREEVEQEKAKRKQRTTSPDRHGASPQRQPTAMNR